MAASGFRPNEDVTDLKDDGTYQFSLGSGNWYARFGHLSQWVSRETETTRSDD